jgi:hypothetical protein
MRLAATLTVTGVIGVLVLEALKVLLAPAGFWLLGVVMFAVKLLLIGLALVATVVVAGGLIWAYRRWARNAGEIGV